MNPYPSGWTWGAIIGLAILGGLMVALAYCSILLMDASAAAHLPG